LAHEALVVEAALGELLHRLDALGLDLREVAVRAERVGLLVQPGGLGGRLGDLRLRVVDRVQREHVDEHADEHGAEQAEDDVTALALAASRLARAMLLGEEVDGLHAVAPSARPTATVWRYGSSPAGIWVDCIRPSGSATDTGTSIIEPSWSARPSRRAPGPDSTTSPTQRASGCAM